MANSTAHLSPSPVPSPPDVTTPLLGSGGEPQRSDLPLQAPSSDPTVGEPSTPKEAIVPRAAATMFCFVVMGLSNSTIGVVLPHLESFYGLTAIQVSLIFLVTPVGYVLAAHLNSIVHLQLGQRGIAVIGPLFHLLFAVVASAHPPFPALLVAVAAGSFGTGLLDGSWCAWAGGVEKANVVSGFLHGSYSAGAAAGPLMAGALLSSGQRPWYQWYYVLVFASLLQLVVLPIVFRHESAEKYREGKHHDLAEEGILEHVKAVMSHRVIWLCAVYLLTYVGIELAISDWIVVFMIEVRHTSPFLASACSSGYWAGQAIGRLILGFVTDRIGVRRATVVYLLFAIALQALFAVVEVPAVSVCVMAMLGFVCGPIFPSCITQLNSMIPRALHVHAVSFVASVGQVGGALLPFGIGALAESLGIQVFQVAVLAQLGVALLLWLLFTRPRPWIDTQP